MPKTKLLNRWAAERESKGLLGSHRSTRRRGSESKRGGEDWSPSPPRDSFLRSPRTATATAVVHDQPAAWPVADQCDEAARRFSWAIRPTPTVATATVRIAQPRPAPARTESAATEVVGPHDRRRQPASPRPPPGNAALISRDAPPRSTGDDRGDHPRPLAGRQRNTRPVQQRPRASSCRAASSASPTTAAGGTRAARESDHRPRPRDTATRPRAATRQRAAAGHHDHTRSGQQNSLVTDRQRHQAADRRGRVAAPPRGGGAQHDQTLTAPPARRPAPGGHQRDA